MEKGQLPDLLVIDGGLGQVNRALQVLGALQLDHEVGVLGIAKGPDRKAGLERFFLGSVAVHIDGHSLCGASVATHSRRGASLRNHWHRQRRAKARNQSLLRA